MGQGTPPQKKKHVHTGQDTTPTKLYKAHFFIREIKTKPYTPPNPGNKVKKRDKATTKHHSSVGRAAHTWIVQHRRLLSSHTRALPRWARVHLRGLRHWQTDLLFLCTSY